MRIEALLRGGTIAAVASILLPDAGHGVAQQSGASLLLIDRDTRVASVDFEFSNGSAIEPKRLRQNIALDGPGALAGLRRTLGFLPGLSSPELEHFSPLTLQKDVVRLRQLYRRAGFPSATLDYDVVLDTAQNVVDVTFVVDQGPAITLERVDVRLAGGTVPMPDSSGTSVDLGLPEDLEDDWRRHLRRLVTLRGNRFGEMERARLENETTDWFLDRGFPWARATLVHADTTAQAVAVELHVEPGPRAHVSDVVIEGRSRLSERVLLREIPLEVGDRYSARTVSVGERELYELDLVRRALGDVPADQARDSTVTVRYRIEEARPRLVWGRVGWQSEAGATAEAHWSHRDFWGGARTFTVSATSETGWGAVEQARGGSVGASALVRQPYIVHRSLSGTVGPFVRYRDDFRDRSLLFGIESALIYRSAPLRTITLQHELSRLRVDDAFQLLPLSQLVTHGDSAFAPVFVKSVIKVAGSYGALDDRLDPRSGFLVEPNLEVTGPSGVSDVEFFRAAIEAVVAIPMSDQIGLFVRATGGRLFPFGKSDPATAASPTRSVVGLRGMMFTAGGTADVRGWGRGLVGSKMPEVLVDGAGNVTSERYIPIGGLARLSGSVELGLPFPFLPPEHGTHVFADAGRVWSPEPGFEAGDPELRRDGWAYSVGGGVQFSTLVGPIRLSIGYKLNPTLVDLLSPNQVASALATDGGLSGLETDSMRRWHLHLSIGRGL